MNTQQIELIPLLNFPRVKAGDNIAQLILESIAKNNINLKEGDIVVITHSIVSVSEGRYTRIEDIDISQRAKQIAEKVNESPERVEIALRESVLVSKEFPVFITKTTQGIITDFSGVDESNAPIGSMIVLPENPDNSANEIHKILSEHVGANVPVIITDTQGRPWRMGAVNLAIGLAGISPFTKNEGKKDIHGNPLRSSLVCIADEIAASSELVMGQADEKIPIVIVRGLHLSSEIGTAREILREDSENLF